MFAPSVRQARRGTKAALGRRSFAKLYPRVPTENAGYLRFAPEGYVPPQAHAAAAPGYLRYGGGYTRFGKSPAATQAAAAAKKPTTPSFPNAGYLRFAPEGYVPPHPPAVPAPGYLRYGGGYTKYGKDPAITPAATAAEPTIPPPPAAAAAAASGGGGGGGSSAGSVLAILALAGAGYAWYGANERANDLQVQLSGKTNSAFVFLKPHACKGTPGKVEDLLESKLKEAGIRITGKGTYEAKDIDQNKYIDTHYGAIANKAVKQNPSELNVPEQGKQEFAKMFGESWDDAIKAGKVYNAKDAAAKLGVDAETLNQKWSKLTRGKDLIKFGGGFYCGKVDGIYVMNGFYMSMRAAYCNPGEKIQWYTVSWPTDALSWEDFRGKVLGATDPSAAPVGSIRRTILDDYKKLGLKSKPDTGDNGVHASASPFEGLAERMNWLGVNPEDDFFGKALLTKVDKATIQKWAGDCQVTVKGETKDGKTTSVFDALEDLDADTSLEKVAAIGK